MLQVDIQLQRDDFRLQARFEAPVPGVTALFGRSGCGKTTLVNLIAGLIRQGTGRISLGDEVWFDSTQGIALPPEKRRIGYVFQDARLFPHYTVQGNLLYGAPRTITAASSAFGDVVALLGLAPLLARRPGGLSGGERQRVALGRALLTQPRLLLLDEPLASLDAARREEVLPYLMRLRDHFAIPMIYVSHQFDEVLRLATHLVALDQGRVVATGDLASASRMEQLRDIVGVDAVGAVIDGHVAAVDAASNLASVAVGDDILRVSSRSLVLHQPVRLQVLARDIILAVEEPRGLSVRNQLRGTVRSIVADAQGDLVELTVGELTLLARVTSAATRELLLMPGKPVWILVKAVSFTPHVIGAVERPAPRQ